MAKGASTLRGMETDTLGMLSKVQSPTRKLLAAFRLQWTHPNQPAPVDIIICKHNRIFPRQWHIVAR